jgi:hypothetical protein
MARLLNFTFGFLLFLIGFMGLWAGLQRDMNVAWREECETTICLWPDVAGPVRLLLMVVGSVLCCFCFLRAVFRSLDNKGSENEKN